MHHTRYLKLLHRSCKDKAVIHPPISLSLLIYPSINLSIHSSISVSPTLPSSKLDELSARLRISGGGMEVLVCMQVPKMQGVERACNVLLAVKEAINIVTNCKVSYTDSNTCSTFSFSLSLYQQLPSPHLSPSFSLGLTISLSIHLPISLPLSPCHLSLSLPPRLPISQAESLSSASGPSFAFDERINFPSLGGAPPRTVPTMKAIDAYTRVRGIREEREGEESEGRERGRERGRRDSEGWRKLLGYSESVIGGKGEGRKMRERGRETGASPVLFLSCISLHTYLFH